MRVGPWLLGVAVASSFLPGTVRAEDARVSDDWSGPYLGVHAGGTWNDIGYSEPDDPAFAFNADADGFAGGLLAGYNHRIDRFMIGAEIDGAWLDAGFGENDAGGNGYSALSVDWNAHLPARFGLVLQRTLVFVAGGLAVAEIGVDDTTRASARTACATSAGPWARGSSRRSARACPCAWSTSTTPTTAPATRSPLRPDRSSPPILPKWT